jgi:hypothetical protein
MEAYLKNFLVKLLFFSERWRERERHVRKQRTDEKQKQADKQGNGLTPN